MIRAKSGWPRADPLACKDGDDDTPPTAVIPAKAGIQYAASSQFHHERPGILGPRLRGDDDEVWRIVVMPFRLAIQPGFCGEDGYKSRFAHINH